MKKNYKIFSPELISKLKSDSDFEIFNIDRSLNGLISAGTFSFWRGDVLRIVPENSNFLLLREELKLWIKLFNKKAEIIVFPLPFVDPYINNRIYYEFHIEKMKLLKSKMKNERIIVIATLLSSALKFEDSGKFGSNIISIKTGVDSGRDKLIEKLFKMGYSHSNYVDRPGEMRKRGGVIDIYPSGLQNPVRIEFFGDKVESITSFDRMSRKSIEKINIIEIPVYGFFGEEMKLPDLLSGDGLLPLTEILKNPKIIFDDKFGVEKSAIKSKENFQTIYKLGDEKDIPNPNMLFPDCVSDFPHLNILEKTDEITSNPELVKLGKNLREFGTDDLEMLKNNSREHKVVVFSKRENIKDNLKSGGIWFESEDYDIPFSFRNIITSTLFITEKKFVYRNFVNEFDEIDSEKLLKTLKIDDFVVHEKHGIGIFKGLSVLNLSGDEQEFVKLEYLNSEILYVPVSEVNVLNKYFSFKGEPQKLDRIGGKSWIQKKIRAKKSIVEFAKELLDLYAVRKSIKGNSHLGDKEMESILRNTFPFVETPDQSKAINEVLKDLERSFPMERLVCGDVSFGKTEVAIRGALRVVCSGKQVAVLCPTTILAIQHYKTFKERMKDLPVNIRMLSRMVSPKEKKEILEELKDGVVDILIGTHSILSKKTEFKNLGLFVIDEEQRFGVFQKEKLKQGREKVDVLILSATPIPRTLSLSMAGLQDISTIRTPPQGRMRIKNYIGTYSGKVIVSAILKEIERGGGVYIIYNSVEKIFSFRDTIRKWLPNLGVTVIHAQMSNTQIEKNLISFINREYSVLLSTTIIENGIDISGVNTLIVIDAEKFGLTQLYQLRGRIGRGNLRAYAYFLTGSKALTEKARLRLEGIRDHSEVGSGFKLAEYDLKLRGAGSLLGGRQHGHIEALGFDYYNEMLKQSIDELKGLKEEKFPKEVKVNFNYSIDSEYISSDSERIEFYSKIIDANGFEEIESIRKHLTDKFGEPEKEAEKIFYVAKVKLIAKFLKVSNIEIFNDKFIFSFESGTNKNLIGKIFTDIDSKPEWIGEKKLIFYYPGEDFFLNKLEKVLKKRLTS